MAKILIVEDEDDIRETTKFSMEAIGYQCITASNGMQGYKKAISEKPDLILLDMMMPVLTGMELLHKLRETHSAEDLPTIMLTAVSDQKNVQNILALGVADYVVKPFDINILIQKVQKVLGSPDETVGMAEDDDVTTITLNQNDQSIAEVIVDAFGQITKLCREGKRKFILNFGALKELSSVDLRRIGDGIGTATEEGVELKFAIPSSKIQQQLRGFYETQTADIYNTHKEALEVFKKQQAVKVVERDGILILTYTDSEATFVTSLKQMFKSVKQAFAEGNKKFILSFADFFNFDNVDLSATKLIVGTYLQFRKKGVDIRFVFPSSKTKEWFLKFSEGVEIEFYMSEEEAVEKFSRNWIFSLDQNGESTIITIKDSLSSSKIWGALKGIFRNIFELSEEGKKKFLVNLTGLRSLDSQSLKLVEGAIGSANSEGIDVKFIANSSTLKEQFENFQGTKNIEVYESIENAI